jgi:Ca2+-binding EF-hand superfamily protein
MNVSQTSGSSAAWMLQRLFQSSDETSTTATAEGAGRQKMPGADGHKCNSGGASAPAMSSGTMSAMVSMQMVAPSASNIASDLIDSLDTDGDGEVSAEEITAAFSSAGLDTSGVADAIGKIDTDANGALSADELTTAISSDMQAHGSKGPPPGGPPPGGSPPGGMGPRADEAASSILSAFDSDGDSSLSLDEILAALGQQDDEDGGVASALSSLDSDGDGKLSLAELTAGLQQDMDAGYRAYAEQAAAQI